MSGRMQAGVRPFAAVALVAAATVAVGQLPAARAAAPSIDGPTRLYMLPADNSGVIPDLLAGLAIPVGTMKFDDVPLGGDVISRQSRVITFESAETAQCNIHGTDGTGSTPSTSDDFSLTGCTAVQLDVNHGTLSFDPAPAEEDDPRDDTAPIAKIYRLPSGALVRDADTPDDLSGPAIAIIGTTAEVNAGMKTLVYTPDTDDGDPNNGDQRDYYYNGANPERLHVLLAPGDPNLPSGTNSWDVDIKVLDYNNFPTMTVPQATWAMSTGMDLDLFGAGAPDDPAQSTVVVADDDNDDVIEDPNDGYIDGKGKQFLVVAWATCGQFAFPSESGFGIKDDLETIFDEVWDRSTDSVATPDDNKQTVKDAFFAALPDEVENLPFATDYPDGMHTAFAGIADDIDWVNYQLGQITFRAKDTLGNDLPDSTCKLRVLVSDLGNNGLPLQYLGNPPTGVEIPMFGFDLDTNYVPTVEELTITVGAGGPTTPTITSVSDVTLAEGTGGSTTPFTFTLTLDAPAVGGETVDVATSYGPAPVTDGTDLAAIAATPVTFAAGATSATFTVPVNQDPTDEPDEHFQLNLSNASGLTIGDPAGLGTVQNDDGPTPPPQVTTFTAQSKAEGTGAGTTAFDFTIGLSAPAPASGVAVRFATTHGTTDSVDLTTTSGQMVVFSAGQTTRTVTVQTNRDATVEPNETFTATLSNPDGVTIAAAAHSATATITNDDLHTVSISDGTVVEGDAGTVNLTFTVSLNGPAIGNESVLVTTGGGNATVVADYTPLTAVPVVFAAGDMSKQVDVVVKGDVFDEPNETFTAVLHGPSNLAITDGFGTGTIQDDDALTVSVADVTLAEGNAGTTNFVFTLALNGPAPAGTSVNAATTNGSATAGPLPDDYTAVNQPVAFVTGAQSATVTVPVHGDPDPESDEDFTLTLSSPVGVAIVDGTAIGTIQNDDGGAVNESVTINDVAMNEGNVGTTTFTFTLTLNEAAEGGEAVTATVTHGTTNMADFIPPAATVVTFANGATTATFDVIVNGDDVLELDETFNVTLSAPQGLLISDMVGVGTLLNDDVARHVTAISDVALAEGNVGTTNFVFTLTLDGPAGELESVVATTTHGSSDDVDFPDGVVPVVFVPGQSTATATVGITGDAIPEPNETFTLTLSNPQNVVIDDATAAGTIQNDDGPMAPPQVVSVSDVTMDEGDAGTTAFVFTLTLNEAASGDESVQVTTNHTDTDDADLTPLTAQTVTFAALATTATVTVLVNGDADVELDETFTLTLGNPQNVTIAAVAQSATGTIVNDDVDVQPPSPLTITVPADITVPNDPGQAGAAVTYPAPTTTGGVPPVVVTCSSPSGGFYPIGVTTVTCTATDSAADQQQQLALAIVSDSFTITVVETTPPSTTTPPSSTTPPVTPPATPVPSSNVTAPDVGQLPATGGDTRAPLVIALTACLVGAVLLLLRRRTRPAA